MRCEEVTRELAAPSGPTDQADLAAHLAACPACAGWSSRADRLDRLWDATRPADPSPGSLDALWARASAALEAPSPALRLVGADATRARRRGRRLALAVIGLGVAQAAALMVVTLNTIRSRDGRGPSLVAVGPELPASRPVAGPSRVDVDVDQTVFVRYGADGHHVDRLDDTPKGFTLAYATPHDVFSAVESAATP